MNNSNLEKWVNRLKARINDCLSSSLPSAAMRILNKEILIIESYINATPIKNEVVYNSTMRTHYYPFTFRVKISVNEADLIMEAIKSIDINDECVIQKAKDIVSYYDFLLNEREVLLSEYPPT